MRIYFLYRNFTQKLMEMNNETQKRIQAKTFYTKYFLKKAKAKQQKIVVRIF